MNIKGEIWAIILAAGESKRMGFPKMLLTFNGLTMIEHVIRNIKMSEVNRTLVVLGANRDEIINLVTKESLQQCYNENFKSGMLSSVRCGFRNLPDEVQAVLVFQGDQPFIGPAVINSVISAYRTSGKGIVIPVCGNKRGHPLLVDIRYRSAIDKISDNEGLHWLPRKFSDDVLEVSTDDQGILRDVDTMEDYVREINKKFKDERDYQISVEREKNRSSC
jgi:molybdenum cofactor cytidylyltransferase